MKAQSSTPLEDRLRGVGLKVTQSRLALLKELAHGHCPFSPEELHSRLNGDLCDLVTVYRSLSVFEAKGLVRRCLFGDGKVRYEIDHGSHHHHHIICRSCGQVRPLSKCALNALEESARETGYAGISHSLEFFGTCPRCVAR